MRDKVMPPWVKGLCHTSQQRDSRNSAKKPDAVAHICNPSPPMWGWRSETGKLC